MQNKAILTIFCGALLLAGCSSKSGSSPGTEQTATVTLKDGANFSGTVTKSDPSAITLTTPTGETRTYPMTQVDSVRYTTAAPTQFATSSPGSAPRGTLQGGVQGGPPPDRNRTIPAGARLRVRNSDRIKAGVAQAGQAFPAVIVDDVIGDDGGVAIPRGSDATLVVRLSRRQGKVKGQSEIVIDLASVTVDGRHYNLETLDIARKGKQGLGKNKRSLKFIGGGAVLGTVIGAVAGGGVGAVIGGAAGAGAGVAVQTLTRGKAVSIPPETILSFRLEAPTEITLAQ